jgi:hypothetical protein
VRFRITHEHTSKPLGREVTEFMAGSRAWWKNFGGVAANGGGAPRLQLDLATAGRTWRRLVHEYAREGMRQPTIPDLLDALKEQGVECSLKTVRRRIGEWRDEGRWPPR